MVCASGLLGNSTRIAATADWIEQPHFWGAIVSPPSGGKTPSQQPFIEVCRLLEKDAEPEWQAACIDFEKISLQSDAKRKHWESEVKEATQAGQVPPDMPKDAIAPESPAKPRLLICDLTMQEGANLLSRNPRGLILIRDELAAWIGSFDRYSGSGADRGFYLECWDGGRFSVDLVKHAGIPVNVPYASLAILGGLQPDKLREALSGPDDGFGARFGYVWPALVAYAPLVREDDQASERRKDFLLTAARRLRGLGMDQDQQGHPIPRIVRLSDDALTLFEKIRKEAIGKARTMRGLAAGWHGKTPARALRLALTIEYLIWASQPTAPEPSEVSATAMAHAGTYLDYLEAMFERVMHGLARNEAEADAAEIMNLIVVKKLETLNERGLYQSLGFAHLRGAERRKAAFAVLEVDNWIKQEQAVRRGRKRADWSINPGVHKGKP
jgi:hypothetical protein